VRIATMIISLVLTLVVWFQSCAATVGGGLGEEFGSATERREGQDLTAAGGGGLIAGCLWVVGGGLVLARPGLARWFYLAAAPIFLAAGAGGYEDAYIWAVVSLIFMAMAWRGIKERERKQGREQEAQYAQFQQWQQWQQQQAQQGTQPPPESAPSPQQGPPPPRH
jgi:hypothetical protein